MFGVLPVIFARDAILAAAFGKTTIVFIALTQALRYKFRLCGFMGSYRAAACFFSRLTAKLHSVRF